MGVAGTDVAKEAADVVLANDELLCILHAVDEGKAIFHNIRNFLTFQLSTPRSGAGHSSFDSTRVWLEATGRERKHGTLQSRPERGSLAQA